MGEEGVWLASSHLADPSKSAVEEDAWLTSTQAAAAAPQPASTTQFGAAVSTISASKGPS
jgi:hypothetical protein